MDDETGTQDEGLFDAAAVVREAIDEIYVIDARTGRFLYANDLALKNTGYTLDELMLMTPLDLQKGTDFETLTQRIEPLRLGDQQVAAFDTSYYRKDGTAYPVEHRVQLLRSQEPPVFVVRAREIAERRLPNSSLLDEPARYHHIVEDSADGVWIIDADDKTTYANEATAKVLGYSRQEMIGMAVYEFLDDEWRAHATAGLAQRRTGERQRMDVKYIRKDGGEIWAIMNASPLFNERGEYVGAYAVITDITERKLQELALLDTLNVSTHEELWGAALPSLDKPLVRMPDVIGVRASRVAKRFSILADPKRLQLIELLASGEERTVTELAESLDMTQSNVSKHLKILAEADLVNRRQDGTRTFYALADPTVAILCRIVCQWLGNQAQAELHALAS
jgi:PAS domain S-box-containing protein